MSLNEIPVNELIRELSAKIGEVVTENIALKIQVAELVSLIARPEEAPAVDNRLVEAYDQRIG